jgi:succinate dehydrogenase/fumarate reductase iron-sulfur protein
MSVQLGEQTYSLLIMRSSAGGISKGTQEFAVALEERMTVLDALFRIQREQDPSLTFRCACRVGMCGTCAVSIDGIPRLACKTRVRTLAAATVRVAPLPHLPVIKDLVVSLEPFFDQWKRVKPRFRPANPDSEELACIPETSDYARLTPSKRDCITCGICYAACGVKSTSGEYLGPAAINRAFLRLMDPRDVGVEDRVGPLNGERGGVWRCHTQFNCTAACPKDITLTDSIARLKRAMLFPGRFKTERLKK